MSGRQDSNLRPPGPKPGALPTALRPDTHLKSMAKIRKKLDLPILASPFLIFWGEKIMLVVAASRCIDRISSLYIYKFSFVFQKGDDFLCGLSLDTTSVKGSIYSKLLKCCSQEAFVGKCFSFHHIEESMCMIVHNSILCGEVRNNVSKG